MGANVQLINFFGETFFGDFLEIFRTALVNREGLLQWTVAANVQLSTNFAKAPPWDQAKYDGYSQQIKNKHTNCLYLQVPSVICTIALIVAQVVFSKIPFLHNSDLNNSHTHTHAHRECKFPKVNFRIVAKW